MPRSAMNLAIAKCRIPSSRETTFLRENRRTAKKRRVRMIVPHVRHAMPDWDMEGIIQNQHTEVPKKQKTKKGYKEQIPIIEHWFLAFENFFGTCFFGTFIQNRSLQIG